MTGSSARPTQTGTKTFPEAAGEAASTRWQTRTDRAPLNPPPGHRIEPSIDDHAFPSGASSAYEKLHGLGPDFGEGEHHRPARSRLWRLTLMTAVFVVGAGVGLAAAWWLQKPPPGASLAASPPVVVKSVPAAPSTDGKRPSTIRGISPSELPYDGAPPPAAAQSPAAPVAAQVQMPPDTDATTGASAVNAVSESKAAAGTSEQETPAPPATVERKPVQDVAQPDKEPKSAKTVKQGGANVASATPKRKSATRTDREIERIRRQVDEELKKKTEHGRGPGDARSDGRQGARSDGVSRRNVAPVASLSRVPATRASLARCDRNTNFIRREFCRWQVCNGSWGKNGCPSYPQRAPNY